MADSTPTANYGWPKPAPGASDDVWGGYLNTSLDGIDATVHGIQVSVPAPYVLPNASTTVLGGVKVDGTTITASGGVISAASSGGAYLPLSGGTLTGYLGGTTAGFSGQISATGATFSDLVNVSWGGMQLTGGLAMRAIAGTQNGRTITAGQTYTAFRWGVTLGDTTPEVTGNVGSNFSISSYSDIGASLAVPLLITRSTGVCTFSAAIVNGPSDRTLKENVEPIEDALDKVMALQGVSFNLISDPDQRHIGLIAQDVEPVVPEIIQHFATHDSEGTTLETPLLALDYPKLTALLIEAVKTLAARVEELEASSG